MIVTGVRRALWLALIATAGGALWTWWRDRNTPIVPSPAEWPPLSPDPAAPKPVASKPGVSGPVERAAAVADPVATSAQQRAAAAPADASTAENEPAVESAQRWVEPDEDGGCPLSHPIKANDNSGIFHVPGGTFHERTRAERCYATSDDATADGYRQAKN